MGCGAFLVGSQPQGPGKIPLPLGDLFPISAEEPSPFCTDLALLHRCDHISPDTSKKWDLTQFPLASPSLFFQGIPAPC